MKKNLGKVAKTLIVSLAIALLISVVNMSVSIAQEINPADGTYSYGSTSEFSPYVTLTSSGTLAPTGDSQTVGYIAALAMLLVSGGIVIAVVKNKNNLLNNKC